MDQELTADTSPIDDEDGLTNATFEYQWIAGGADIDGATGSSYLLTSSEQGQTIKVKVSFTDDRNNAETRTSVPTVAVAVAPNREATGSPTIAGSPQVRETLKADTANIADEDGLDDVSYSYQWLAAGSNIDGATGSSFTLTASQQGQTIQVRVGFTDDAGNRETLTSQATDAVAAKPIPLTASFSGVPGSHSGSGEFTFDLSFSENVKAGYERIRDKAFDIDDGDITKAQRKQQGSNQTWTITVEPDGNGAISITLPETTGCDADGAICTGAGKKLSGTVELTVNGPEQQSQEQPNNPATGLPTITGNPPGGPDPDSGHLSHRRRGRAGQRFLQLPMARRRRRDTGSNQLDLRAVRLRRWQDHQGTGEPAPTTPVTKRASPARRRRQ